LEEIVVTAEKRSENLQNVPITVTAVTAAALAANKVESTQDLQFLVPSLVYNSASGFAQPFLRGIGSDFTVPNADPSVATYIDGAFVADQVATIQGLLAVDRVEVLEGPQGTLYGRNAVGGVERLVRPRLYLGQHSGSRNDQVLRRFRAGHISTHFPDRRTGSDDRRPLHERRKILSGFQQRHGCRRRPAP
jgi:outer membrane cobalamin receptor